MMTTEMKICKTRRSLPGWLPVTNWIIVRLQKLGIPLGTMRVLAVPGRKSGELRETPFSPLTVDGNQYVIAGFTTAELGPHCPVFRIEPKDERSEPTSD